MISLLRWVARRSLGFVHGIGLTLGWLAYGFSASYRRRLKGNAARAGVSARQRRRAVGEAGKMVAELPWLWLSPAQRRVSALLHWQGESLIEDALIGSRGLILLTPHLGSFEVCARAYAERFGHRAPLTALYRPARQAWLRELEASARARPGLHTAPASLAGVRQMIRALRRGETVGLLPDQVPPQGLGVWAPFFGQEAYTMTLASRLLEQTGAQLLLMWAERLDGGQGWHVRVHRPEDLRKVAADQVDDSSRWEPAGINALMEALILLAPHQYLWGYHRYKQPRQVESLAPNA